VKFIFRTIRYCVFSMDGGCYDVYGMRPVACHDTSNGAVYTTLSTNVNKDKSILMYHLSFNVQMCSATYFDLQDK
jgi:hypothetical protein